MPLFQKITDDMKTAMKSGDKARLEVIRFSIADLKAAEKEKQSADPSATLTDDDIIELLKKEVKKRRNSIDLFRQGDRQDLIEKEETDIAIISEYLPKELSREEIEKIVDDLKVSGTTEFSALMKATMAATKGNANGKLVGEIVKEKTQ